MLLKNKIVSNQKLAEELHKPLITCKYALGCSKLWKPIIKKFKKQKQKQKQKIQTHTRL